MHYDAQLIATVAAGLVLAYILGLLANRLRLPPLVGYLLAGLLVGPLAPGFSANATAIGGPLIAFGIALLMFGIGLRFSLRDLTRLRLLAIPGAIAQMVVTTLLGMGLGLLVGWTLPGAVLFGLALSSASSIVLFRALQDRRLLQTERGQIAMDWLIVQNLVMVLALVLLPAIASASDITTATVHDPFVSFVERLVGGPIGLVGVLAVTLVKILAFLGFMLIVGRSVVPWLLQLTARAGSRELGRLAVIAVALGVALGSALLFGVPLALGAFLAGMILCESPLTGRIVRQTLPLREAFGVLFFLALGMLFDPSILLRAPLPVLSMLAIILIGKSAAAFFVLSLTGRSTPAAATVGAALAQVGEFAFVLVALGVSLALLPPDAQDFIVAGAFISILVNPLVFWLAGLALPHVEKRVMPHVAANQRIEPSATSAEERAALSATAEPVDRHNQPTTLGGHKIVVGYGHVGRRVAEGLTAQAQPLLLIEDAEDSVADAREDGIEVVTGNAALPKVLRLANVGGATTLLIALSDGFASGAIARAARKLNPSIRIIARAGSPEEDAYLRSQGADVVILAVREVARGMLESVVAAPPADIVAPPPPPEPKLPPVDNLIAAAAVASATAEAVVPASAEPPAIVVTPTESVIAADPDVIAPPEVAATGDSVEPEPVIEPTISPETGTAIVGEAPPAIDEVIPLPPPAESDDTPIPMPPPEPAPEPEPESTPEIAPVAEDAETAAQEADEISEGGIAPPEPDDIAPAAEDKPEGVVPPVTPEPKG